MRADQSISSQAMREKLRQVVGIVHRDPAVATVVGFTGGGRAGGGFMFVNLKPRRPAQRERPGGDRAAAAAARAGDRRCRSFSIPCRTCASAAAQSNSTYQYTLKSDNLADLRKWATRLADEMKQRAVMTDVDTDQQDNGVETLVEVDRDSAARLGITSRGDRRRPLRRLRAAPGRDHLRRAEPVPRDHGVGAGLCAGPERVADV